MKSPNGKISVRLLQTAEQAIRVAYEDLKNDEDVRDCQMSGGTKLTEELLFLEQQLQAIQKALRALGY